MPSSEPSGDRREVSGSFPPVAAAANEQALAMASNAYPRLDRARTRTVRLVISIPGLTLLVVLGSGMVLYVYLQKLSDSATANRAVAESLERASLLILMLSIGVSLISAVVGYILAREIVKPIRDLMDTMDSIAAGDLHTKVEPFQLGEFGQLGFTFNRMVEQLNKLFEERDRQLRESFTGAHLILDRKGFVLQADNSAQRLFAVSGKELAGSNLLDGVPGVAILKSNPGFLRALQECHREALEGRAGTRNVAAEKTNAKSPVRFLVSCLSLEGSGMPAANVLMEVRDISSISTFYEQMQRADRMAAVGTLATGIAHEIRNPLASIRGMVQLLAEDAQSSSSGESSSASVSNYHARLLKEVDRLDKLISGIMDFAQTGKDPVETVDLNELLRDVVTSARAHVGEVADHVALQWELEQNFPLASLQVERLKQALLNLIVNAYQHCSEHKVSPIRIQTLYLPVNSQRPLILCIANPCEPIPAESRERFFEPFFTTKSGGTGLGLPIAYQTVLANGGILEMECENGEILFWIRLPKHGEAGRGSSGIIPIPREPVAGGARLRVER